jgi:hypothetical protein
MITAEKRQIFEIRPIDMSLTERYVDYFELYNEQLSSTKIVLVKDLVEERVSILSNIPANSIQLYLNYWFS